MILTQREDQDKLLKSSEADEIAGDSQEEPTDLKDNPAYVSRISQEKPTDLKDNPAYVSRNSQEEPTDLKDNPAYLSVSTMPQFTMSADAVYSTVDEANLQNIPHDNSANFSLKMSVPSF